MSSVKLLSILALCIAGLAVVTDAQPPCCSDATVSAVGDPHLVLYDGKYVTCGADGWRTYLLNKHFDLNVHVTSLWMDEIHLTFLSHNNRVRYIAPPGPGSLPTTLTVHLGGTPTNFGNIFVFPFPPFIVVADFNSYTAFIIFKFGSYHNIWVVSGACVFEQSCGLMIDGCPNDYISLPGFGRKKRRAAINQCEVICAGLKSPLYEACMFDCAENEGNAMVRDNYNGVKDIDRVIGQAKDKLRDGPLRYIDYNITQVH